MEFEIRKARVWDCPGLLALVQNTPGNPDVTLEELALRLERMDRADPYRVFVAVQDAEILGYISTVQELSLEIDHDYIRILGLSVGEEHQRLGIGSKLLQYVEAWVAKRGIRHFALSSSLAHAEAQAFCEHNGFTKVSYGYTKSTAQKVVASPQTASLSSDSA